jgi:hypothetical protein
MILHQRLSEICEEEFRKVLAGKPQVYYDGLELKLLDGSTLTVRYNTREEYSFQWNGRRMMRIDTAPLHKGLDTFPNHLHDGKDKIKKDDITNPKDPPEDNLRRVIRFITSQIQP